jgi:peroxin-5
VHFDESTAPSSDVGKLGNGVPSSLEEALHHATSIPGKSSSWEETAFQDDADFDVESFMQFNGEQRVQPDTRIGVGALENWGEMQEEREKLEQAPASERRATYRGMGREDRYLFQSRNPYSQAAAEAEKLADDVKQMGRESPTLKVSDLRWQCCLTKLA